MYCNKCGSVNSEGSSFCAYCGNLMTNQANMDTSQLSAGSTFKNSNENTVDRKKKANIWIMVAAVFVVVLAVMILVISGNGGSSGGIADGTDTKNAIIEKPANPMESMAYDDVNLIFSEEYPNFAIKSISTVKSMTEDKIYEITLSVSAENQYSLWTYEVYLEYSKYDQGWMMEKYSIHSQGYEVIRNPKAEDMTEILQERLRAVEEYMRVDVVQITECSYNEQTQQIVCAWIGQEEMLHAVVEREYLARFDYSEVADNWFITLEGNGFDSPEIEILSTAVNQKNVDFSGTWEASVRISPNGYGEIEISNYNGNELDLIFYDNCLLDPDYKYASEFEILTNGTKNNTSYHFTKCESQDEKSTDCNAHYYCAKIDMYLQFSYLENKTEIEFGSPYYIDGNEHFDTIGISYDVPVMLPELIDD